MDDGLLRELIELQKEENQLLKRHLWRLRFSLLSLLLLTTATAIGLGFLVYEQQTKVTGVTSIVPSSSAGSYSVWSAPSQVLTFGPEDTLNKEPSATFLQYNP